MPSRFSHVQLFVTLWTVAHQAPLSRGFPRQEYWSGLLFHSPGDIPNPGMESVSPALAGEFFTAEPPGKHYKGCLHFRIITTFRPQQQHPDVKQFPPYLLSHFTLLNSSLNASISLKDCPTCAIVLPQKLTSSLGTLDPLSFA